MFIDSHEYYKLNPHMRGHYSDFVTLDNYVNTLYSATHDKTLPKFLFHILEDHYTLIFSKKMC